MSMAYIRDHYGVPAKRGARVRYTGSTPPREGVIVGSSGEYIRVRMDDTHGIGRYHPTYKIEYLVGAR